MNKSDLIELLIIFVRLRDRLFLFNINNIQTDNILKDYEIFLIKNSESLKFDINEELKEIKELTVDQFITYCNTNINHLKDKIINYEDLNK